MADPVETTSPGALFEVRCPCCGATLQIDGALQLVRGHGEPEKSHSIEDLHTAVLQLKNDEERRNDIFEKSFASHRSSEHTRARKFDELLKQAKSDTSGTPVPRPFDLD